VLHTLNHIDDAVDALIQVTSLQRVHHETGIQSYGEPSRTTQTLMNSSGAIRNSKEGGGAGAGESVYELLEK
jgi:hypothetical protein